MTYNRFLYNSALWNAGREDAGPIARSIIQAHTGPHLQAVIGSTAGVSLISDFIIEEGSVVKPPSSFKFPDLSSRVNAVFPGQVPYLKKNPFLPANIHAWGYGDMNACVFLVTKTPDLGGNIFGLFEATLAAFIEGSLGEKDLAASIFGAAADFPAIINELLEGSLFPFAPSIGGRMTGIASPTLRAMIHTPLDLIAYINPVHRGDLLGQIRGFQTAVLTGKMLGIPTPQVLGFIRGVDSGTLDLPTNMRISPEGAGELDADINPVFTGDTGFKLGLPATISDTGTVGHTQLPTFIRGGVFAHSNLTAKISTGGTGDLGAYIELFGADNLQAYIGSKLFDQSAKNLEASAQPVHPYNLSAVMTINENVAFLGASIAALRDTKDLGAFIRVSETFVTAVMNVSTMSASSLRAVIGRPDCTGGSGNSTLAASAYAQHVGDISAYIESWAEATLGAKINSGDLFHAIDSISVSWSPRAVRDAGEFLTCDTIPVTFSPFRGSNLGAFIQGTLTGEDLAATVTATFPLMSVVPAINRITSADIKDLDEFDLQEIRLQMEGELVEYFYVSGTEKTFAKDANADWKINIRSFRPIADNLFGEFAAARVCRLAELESFQTIDEAVRFCIQSVIGLTSRADMGAAITGIGQIHDLNALLQVNTTFHDLRGRIYPTSNPSSISAYVNGMNAALMATIRPVNIPAVASMSAAIAQLSANNLIGDITGAYTPGSTGGGTTGLGAIVPAALHIRGLISYIDSKVKTKSLDMDGVTGEFVQGPSLAEIGYTPGEPFTVGVWMQRNAQGIAGEGILGNFTDRSEAYGGFGLQWLTNDDIRFMINGYTNQAKTYLEYPESWQFICGVYDPSLPSDNIKVYAGYGYLGSTRDDHTIPISNMDQPIFLGKIAQFRSGSGDELHSGARFHEMMIWEDALSQAAIRELTANPPGQVARMDPSTSGIDYTSNDKLLLHWDMETLQETAPIIEPLGQTTASGTLVNLDASDVLDDISPSISRGSVDGKQSSYWYAPLDERNPFPINYAGSCSIWSVCTFTSNSVLSIWGLGESSVGDDAPFRLVKNSLNPYYLYAQANDEASHNPYQVQGPAIPNNASTFYSCVVTYDEDTAEMSLYVNGTDYGSVTVGAGRQKTNETAIGASYWDNTDYINKHRGDIEALGFWDRVLTAEEMDVLFDLSEEPLLLDHPTLRNNLTAWYRPGEAHDSGGMLDMSGNGKYLSRGGNHPTWTSRKYAQ